MNATEVFDALGHTYLQLNRPQPDHVQAVERVKTFLPKIDDQGIKELLVGDATSWRERLVGLVLAVQTGSFSFIAPIIESLSVRPTGLTIVPAFAALAALINRNPNHEVIDKINALDPSIFDGELGWARDKFLFYVGLSDKNPSEWSPNDGKCFEDELRQYRDMLPKIFASE